MAKKTKSKKRKMATTNWWVYRFGNASASWYYKVVRASFQIGASKKCPNDNIGYSTLQQAANAMVYMENNSGSCPP